MLFKRLESRVYYGNPDSAVLPGGNDWLKKYTIMLIGLASKADVLGILNLEKRGTYSSLVIEVPYQSLRTSVDIFAAFAANNLMALGLINPEISLRLALGDRVDQLNHSSLELWKDFIHGEITYVHAPNKDVGPVTVNAPEEVLKKNFISDVLNVRLVAWKKLLEDLKKVPPQPIF